MIGGPPKTHISGAARDRHRWSRPLKAPSRKENAACVDAERAQAEACPTPHRETRTGDRASVGLAAFASGGASFEEKTFRCRVVHDRPLHDVAAHLVPAFQRAFPPFVVDEGAVFFGAATHDIGQALAPSELSEPRKTHKRLGDDLLRGPVIACRPIDEPPVYGRRWVSW